MPQRSRQLTDEEHFARGFVVQPNGCWLWSGHPSSRYPAFRFHGRRESVHRVSWMIYRGPIPAGIEVCHDCPAGDNTRCVNPDHLFLGTQADNLQDMAAKGRHGAQRDPAAFTARLALVRTAKQGEENPAAKLTEADVIELRNLRAVGLSYSSLVDHFGISKSQVSRICKYQSWNTAA